MLKRVISTFIIGLSAVLFAMFMIGLMIGATIQESNKLNTIASEVVHE